MVTVAGLICRNLGDTGSLVWSVSLTGSVNAPLKQRGKFGLQVCLDLWQWGDNVSSIGICQWDGWYEG